MKKKRKLLYFFKGSLYKILLKMKLLAFFLFVVLSVSAAESYSQAQKFNFKFNNVSVLEVFKQIEENSEFIFLYNEKWLDVQRKVNVNVKNESIEEVLDQLFEKTENVYKIYDRQIVILKDENDETTIQEVTTVDVEEAFRSVQPQDKMLQGRVVDEAGLPLPGVSVVLKGTTIGTVTDQIGVFSLIVPIDAEVLQFSFVGMTSQEVPIASESNFSIVLKEETVGIEDVVVVGYGIQKKASLVGAVSAVEGEALQRMRVPEVSNALTGSIPGLITIQQTSIPGGGDINTLMSGSSGDVDQETKIYIRGQSTWNGGQPLILVDGIERRMEELEPNDIASISVLKDASATAVFGVRGANGVILITTRRGLSGKPKIRFEAQQSTSFISKISTPLNSYEANLLKNYAIINSLNLNPSVWESYVPQKFLNYYKTQEYPEIYPDVDWADEMMKNAATAYKFNTNISGGTKFVKYFGSIGYMHEGGILKGEDLGYGYKSNFNHNRFNFRSNLDFNFTPVTKVSLSLSGNYGYTTNPGYSDNPIRSMRGLYGMPPDLFPIRYSDGYYGQYSGIQYENPYIEMNLAGIDRMIRGQVFTDVSLEQKLDFITKGLSVKGTVSYDHMITEDDRSVGGVSMLTKYIDPRILEADEADAAQYIYYSGSTGTHGYDFYPNKISYISGNFNSLSRSLFYQFAFNYNRDFGKHSVTGLALMNRRESGSGSSFVSKREDWVGRITYNYDLRYVLEVNAGYNGSEKFDRKYRFGFFPSVGAAWVISNETFFKEAMPWWSTLKLRYSHGMVGSDDGIARWLYVDSWKTSSAQYMFGQPATNSGYRTAFEGAVANPNIHWEKAIKKDIAIEAGFFDDQFSLGFDYFTDDREDMLIAANDRTTPVIVGAPLPAANIGKTETSGYESEIGYRKYFPSGIGFSSRFSFAYVKDEIIFRDDPQLTPFYQKQAGYPIGQTRSYVDYATIQNWDEMYTTTLYNNNANMLPGDRKVIDFNSDGIIDVNDVVPYGFPARPQYNYSLNMAVNYKGFSINALFYGVSNVNVNQDYYPLFPIGFSLAYPFSMTDAWSPELNNTGEATGGSLRYSTGGVKNGTYGMIDGSYLRLKNLEFAYELSDKTIEKLGFVNSLRFYVTGYNLLTWTKDEWREDRESPGVTGGGSNVSSYPLMKRFTAGISFGF